MYQILLKKDNSWQQYRVNTDISTTEETIVGTKVVTNIKTAKVSTIFDAKTLEELQEEYKKLLNTYPAQNIMPIKSMKVVNNTTITESTIEAI